MIPVGTRIVITGNSTSRLIPKRIIGREGIVTQHDAGQHVVALTRGPNFSDRVTSAGQPRWILNDNDIEPA